MIIRQSKKYFFKLSSLFFDRINDRKKVSNVDTWTLSIHWVEEYISKWKSSTGWKNILWINTCSRVYECMYVCMHVCVYINKRKYMSEYLWKYITVYILTYILYVYKNAWISLFLFLFLSLSLYIYINYKYIYIYIYKL